MLLFPNAKINLGLRILRRRADGYHDIDTVMIPIGWRDVLEIVPAEKGEGSFTLIGEDTLGLADHSDNLVLKALRTLEEHIGSKLPPLDIYLTKVIPCGAGLGGGSSDAAFAIKGANAVLSLGLSDSEMATVAAKVGADCPFFIYNRPMLAGGIGEILTEINIPALNEISIVVVKPESEAVSTRDAYAGVEVRGAEPCKSLEESLQAAPELWHEDTELVNDFEASIFRLRPQIAAIKSRMESAGAFYTAMSGSGAAVYGLFANDKLAEAAAGHFMVCDIYCGHLSSYGVPER